MRVNGPRASAHATMQPRWPIGAMETSVKTRNVPPGNCGQSDGDLGGKFAVISPMSSAHTSGSEKLTPPSDELMCSITAVLRSEERRVGKECRSRWSPYH